MTLILSGTDGVSDVDGSAATPAVRGADANTGIFFPAADTIGFSEGGVEVARITNTAAWSFGSSGTATGTNGQVLTSAGSGAAPAWANLPAGASLVRVARTSNTALTAANISNLIDITSGTFTQTFDACASLGNGWFCYLDNSGTGDITLDPSGSETIDGLTSFVMYPGEVRLVQCDGTALRTIVVNAFYRTFTASGTFTTPPGYTQFSGYLWGAGGAGGRDTSQVQGPGGGGGNCLPFTLAASSFGTSQTVTIGAGGAATSTDGGNGGNSSIGSLAISYGGGGGISAGNPGCGGGALTAGTAFEPGRPFNNASVRTNTGFGGGAANFDAAWGGAGGSTTARGGQSVWGGGGGSAAQQNLSGGVSIYGGNGGSGSAFGTAGAGAAPGGGGGGTWTGTSGAGGRGELRIWGII